MKEKKIKQHPGQAYNNILKSSGIACSRKELNKMGRRFICENASVLSDAHTEIKVLNMKRFYKRKGWSFPPQKANSTLANMINGYYGKELVESV